MRLYILARVELQLHALNCAGSTGHFNKLQEAYIIKDGEVVPCPVISGNALKNYHARAFVKEYVSLGGKKLHKRHFVDQCRVTKEMLSKDFSSKEAVEEDIVRNCAVCDVHGFLLAEKVNARRESLVKFSFAVPTEDTIARKLTYTIVHNRVSPKVSQEGKEEMMIFRRQYASAIYSFASIFDFAGVGRSQYVKEEGGVWRGKLLVDEAEAALRARAAVRAYTRVLSGELGANTSRALPITRVRQLVAVVAKSLVPCPMHPFYEDYVRDLAKLISKYSDRIHSVLVYDSGGSLIGLLSSVEACGAYYEVVEKAEQKILELLGEAP